MTSTSYPTDKTAILLVDPYNDFMSVRGKLWPLLRKVAKKVNAVENLQTIVTAARAKNIPIVYSPHQRYSKGVFASRKYLHPSQVGQLSAHVFEDGKFGGAFFAPLAPQEGDLIASQHACSSGFAETDLHEKLTALGITHIIIIGFLSNTCIEATARSAVDLDYHVTLVTDAVASWSPKDHQAAVASNYQLLGQIVTTTEPLVQLLDTFGETNV